MSTSTLCRVCVSEQSELVNMLNLYYGSTPATTFIMDILQIKVDSEGSSALVMCSSCNTTLNNFHSFYNMVRDAQHKYNQMINNTQVGASHKYITIHPMKGETLEVEFTVEDGIHSENIVKCKQEVNNEDSGPNCSVESLTEISDNPQENLESGVELEIKTNSKKESKQTMKRKQIATKAMLTKYKMGEMTDGKQWLLADDQIEEMLSLYVDMKCVHCAAPPFNTYTQLENHCMDAHGAHLTLLCCRTHTTNREDLKSHILFSHILQVGGSTKIRIVPCPVCKKLVKHMRLKDHLSTHLPHDKREFQCNKCHLGFGTQRTLNSHISKYHSGTTFSCGQCEKTFTNQISLLNHRRNVHSRADNPFLCPDCGKTIKYFSQYEDHMKEHHGVLSEKVRCHLCDKVVKRISIAKHMMSHDPKNIKQCPHCPYKAFSISDHIKRIHKKVKPYVCSYCTMSFYCTKNMEDHIASQHTRIPAYTCEFCNKTFMSSGNYHAHRKNVHTEQWLKKKKMLANKDYDTWYPYPFELRENGKKRKVLQGAEADSLIQNVIQRRPKQPETETMPQEEKMDTRQEER